MNGFNELATIYDLFRLIVIGFGLIWTAWLAWDMISTFLIANENDGEIPEGTARKFVTRWFVYFVVVGGTYVASSYFLPSAPKFSNRLQAPAVSMDKVPDVWVKPLKRTLSDEERLKRNQKLYNQNALPEGNAE